jgi:hypothetical protein
MENIKSRYAIGFAGTYYTFWNIITSPKHYVHPITGTVSVIGLEVHRAYHQNLSIDLPTALQKGRAMAGYDLEVDEELRGRTSSWDSYSDHKENYPSDVFSYGKLVGCVIAECNDVWQLMRIYEDKDEQPVRRVHARARLIQLGTLVRYRIELGEGRFSNYCTEEAKQRAEIEKAKPVGGFYGNEGDKIELELTLVERFGFMTDYGYKTIQRFRDSQNRLFVYAGTSPKDIELNATVVVKATVKHDHHYETTNLLRMKVA